MNFSLTTRLLLTFHVVMLCMPLNGMKTARSLYSALLKRLPKINTLTPWLHTNNSLKTPIIQTPKTSPSITKTPAIPKAATPLKNSFLTGYFQNYKSSSNKHNYQNSTAWYEKSLPLAGLLTIVLNHEKAYAQEKETLLEFTAENVHRYRHIHKKEFIELAKKHITAQDIKTINAIIQTMETHPEVAEELTPLIIERFNDIHGLIIKEILRLNPKAKDSILEMLLLNTNPHLKHVIEHADCQTKWFYTGFPEDYSSASMLEKIGRMSINMRLAVNNQMRLFCRGCRNIFFKKPCTHNHDHYNWRVYPVNSTNPEDALFNIKQEIIDYAVKHQDKIPFENFITLDDHFSDYPYYNNKAYSAYKIRKIIHQIISKKDAKKLSIEEYVQEYVNAMKHSHNIADPNMTYRQWILHYYHHPRPTFTFDTEKEAEHIMNLIQKQPTLFSKQTIRDFYSVAPKKHQEELKKMFSKPLNTTNIVNSLIDNPNILYAFTVCTAMNDPKTQTSKHACQYQQEVTESLRKYTASESLRVKKMFKVAHNIEHREIAKGNYVFYHGRKWRWSFISDMYKFAHNLNKESEKRIGNHYVFLRFDNSQSHFAGNYDALYMNGALFASTHWYGNSTTQLILKGFDWSGDKSATYTTRALFSTFKLSNCYMKYKTDFDRLEELHQKSNPNNIGNLLVLAIDNKHIDQVYSAGSIAYQKMPIELSNGAHTENAKFILDDLRSGKIPHSDHIQYVLPLTKDYALNPSGGLRMYSLGATDPVIWKEYCDLRAELFRKIEADMQQDKEHHENT